MIRPVAAAVAACVVLCGAAQAEEPSPALAKVIDAAKKEPRLNLEWGGGILAGADGLKLIGDAMNAKYGTNIAIRFTPGPSLPEIVNQVVLANAAGSPSPTDAVIGSDQHAADLAAKGVSVPIDWVSLLPGRIDPSSVEAEGRAIRIYTTMPGGIVYNTKLAPMVPTKLTDLLRPEWKGKIASTPYAGSWELLTGSDVWGERGVEFARELSPQLGGLIRCSDLERVASGEFVGFAMDCSGREWVDLVKKGAPIAHVTPEDFAALRFYYFSIPKNAAAPDAAILFVTFLETPEGQRFVWKYANTDLYTYPDSQLAPEIDAAKKRGIQFHYFTIQWHRDHPEGQVGLEKAVKILSGR
ncbi:MAG TPA: ABC transporter substrate-binding protein [Stellaceae bacterium]